MSAQTRTLRLDRNAGEALRLVEVLVGRRQQHLFDAEVLPRHDRPGPLPEAVARTITAACMGLLFTHGATPRTVLRRGQRVAGRIWDPAVNDIDGVPFSLRFSVATDTLWREGVAVLGDRVTRARSETDAGARERNRKLFRGFATRRAITAGDEVFFALVQQNLPKLRLTAVSEERASARLRSGSTFARLLAPQLDGPVAADTLLDDPHTLRVIELLSPWIGRCWAQAFPSVWSAENLDQALGRCRSFQAVLTGWVTALDRRGRLDLLDPVIDWLAAVPDAVPADIGERLLRIGGVQTIADRDRLAQAIGAAVDPGILDGPRATLAACRYGDERFAEAQLGLRLLDERWVPVRDAVTATARRLLGRIGG